MDIQRPMLATNMPVDYVINENNYVWATPKYDGLRFYTTSDGARTRSGKRPKNRFVLSKLDALPAGLDGEFMAGTSFQECTSAFMSAEGEPEFELILFDKINDSLAEPYEDRYNKLKIWVEENKSSFPFISVIERVCIKSNDELNKLEEEYLLKGFEGIVTRAPLGKYKEGRSTVKEGYMLKVKRFLDAEGEIIGFQELLHNKNEAVKNSLGYTERSSHKENKVASGMLGKFIVKDLETGKSFGVGSGFTAAQRKEFWANRDSMIGQLLTYKYFPIGEKDLPRHPTFLRLRDRDDM